MLLRPIPLVLDLDGTLIRTDTFHEMIVQLLLQKSWKLLLLPFWLWKGRPFAKARLVEACDLALPHLPYNTELMAFAQKEAQTGRSLILATGTDQRLAQKIANYLGFFQEVIGSNGSVNMTGIHKQQALLDRFGVLGFDYAGDSRIDAHIWKSAHKALVVHPKWGVLKYAYTLKGPEHILSFPREIPRFVAFFLALRPFFWLSNLFVPSLSLFVALSILSSGLLIGGDILTLSQERKASFKKSVFAEGHLHLITGLFLAPLFILLAFFLILLSSQGIFFSLLYILLFVGLDRFTRPFSQSFRWALLSFFQLLVGLMIRIFIL